MGLIPTVVRQTFQLARCGCTLRVTSQTLYSPKYITPTQKKSIGILTTQAISPRQNISKIGEVSQETGTEFCSNNSAVVDTRFFYKNKYISSNSRVRALHRNHRATGSIPARGAVIEVISQTRTNGSDLFLNEQNFDLDKSRQTFHHSLKEHHKISNIPKFRCEML